MEVVSPIPSSESATPEVHKSYFQALAITGVEEFVAHSAAVNCLKIGRKSSRVLVTGGEDHKVNLWAICKPNAILVNSVTFDASEVLVAAGAASQNNQSRKRKELDKKIKGCGGMARKICFLRLNVKGWSSFKEFIDKEGKKDLADVEVTLGELEAELSETNVPIDILEAPFLQEPIDPTKQVKLGFLNGLVPRDKSMVFGRILFRAPKVTS
ncbi:hypothetical protein HID58_027573 [Brassica napus]|uniref:Uncharacterized protein n=1 Tax=Brassica napus TaxID=3708 RepID=A0ABQ8CTK6_BRANA|nr:hypothetical protein HID58_027573 [Brassica napus]